MIEHADFGALAEALAAEMARALARALDRDGRAAMALSGGRTPGPILDRLSRADLDWSRVQVMATDERWVAEDDPRSNAGLIRARLMTGPAAAARLVPLADAGTTPEAGAAALEDGVRAALPLTVVLLGTAPDMHTASLFPGAAGLEAALRGPRALLPIHAEQAPEPRVTLSAPVLGAAEAIFLVITGQEKRAAVARAGDLPAEEAPIGLFLPRARIHWAP